MKPSPTQKRQGVPLIVRGAAALRVADTVDKDVQWAFGGGPGVELSQRACSSVSGVDVGRQAVRLTLGVELAKLWFGEIDLSPDFEQGRGVGAPQSQGYALYRPQVGRHVLSHDAIAACSATYKHTVLVGQPDGEAVVFKLAHHIETAGFKHVGHTRVPGDELLVIKGVAQAQHGAAVRDLLKPFSGRAADTLSRGVRCHQVRVLLLQLPEIPHESVELGIGDFGAVLDMI